MAVPSPCPPAERLRELLRGVPAPPDEAELVAHLDHCAACQETLERLAGANPALLGAATTLRRGAYASEASLRRVLDSIGGGADLNTVQRRHDRTTWVQSLLRPAGSPEALGRLDGYEVAAVLGQGGMGLVLKAFEPPLKRWVA